MLDFLKDILISFHQTSLERLKSPFMGTFVFAWISINWPSLAIIFASKTTIENRIQYIFTHYDVVQFLIQPFILTLLICLMLPLLNKLFITYQRKPIDAASAVIMDSRIALSEKQHQIAKNDAKKIMAVKKEEREIEENIDRIKDENIKLKELSKTLQEDYQKSITTLNEERVAKNTLQNLYDNELENNASNREEIKQLQQINNELILEGKDLSAKLVSANQNMEASKRNLIDCQNKMDALMQTINDEEGRITALEDNERFYEDQITNLYNLFPNIFFLRLGGGPTDLCIFTPAVDPLIELSNDMAAKINNPQYINTAQKSKYPLRELLSMRKQELFNSASLPKIFNNQ